MVSHAARPAESARMPVTRRPLGTVSRSVANPLSSRRMRIDSSDGSSAVVAANQTTVTPAATDLVEGRRPGPLRSCRGSPAGAGGRRAGPGRRRAGSPVAGRAAAVGSRTWVAGVREPSHPLPGTAGGGRVGGVDLEVVGSVEGGELADQGAGEGACTGRWAGEGQDGELAEGNGHRGVGEPACPADEVHRRLEELGVVLDQWAAGGVEPGWGGEGDGGAADPHREEVGVGGAAFPEPGGPVDRRPERRQVGVEVLGDGELGGGQLVGLDRDPLEVGEVAGPFAASGSAGGAALDQAEHEARHDRGDGGPGHQGDQPCWPGAGDGEQERHRPTAADQRHQVLEPAGEAGGGPADRRRGRHRQLDRRQRARIRPHRPMHQEPGGGGCRGRHDRTLRPRPGHRGGPRQVVDNLAKPPTLRSAASAAGRRSPLRGA